DEMNLVFERVPYPPCIAEGSVTQVGSSNLILVGYKDSVISEYILSLSEYILSLSIQAMRHVYMLTCSVRLQSSSGW
ncbi:unnamed protein product, partial [Urochloa humidicola]